MRGAIVSFGDWVYRVVRVSAESVTRDLNGVVARELHGG
jgi:hypothetical protein